MTDFWIGFIVGGVLLGGGVFALMTWFMWPLVELGGQFLDAWFGDR